MRFLIPRVAGLITAGYLLSMTAAIADAASALPQWLQDKRLSEVYETTYQGRTVYFVPPRCCDIPSQVFDAKGELICMPTGGFAGGDGKCPRFDSTAPMRRVLPARQDRN